MEKEIIEKFLLSKNEKLLNIQEMKKGTDSKVFLVNKKYIFKFHNKNVIKAEYEFFNLCKNDLNEQIVFVDENFNYIVYKFIENDGKVDNVANLVETIKKYIEGYSDFDGEGYGFLFEETKGWEEFLNYELDDKKEFALKVLNEEDYKKVQKAIKTISNFGFEKKLMHGDFGFHNMLFLNGKLAGVIDPQPMIGDPLYDFVFCILSDEDIAQDEIVSNFYKFVPTEPKEKVEAMILFVLFGRIARCVKYHLEELKHFIKLWQHLNI